MKPAIMRMVVDFPAPLAPRNPNTSPGATEKVNSSTASLSPYRLDRFFVVIMAALETDQHCRFPKVWKMSNFFSGAGSVESTASGPLVDDRFVVFQYTSDIGQVR